MITNPSQRCYAHVDLDALENNVAHIRKALPEHIRYLSVVKADAYGHGLEPIVRRLSQCGVVDFAVANVHEADAIRETGAAENILILSALLPCEMEILVANRWIATVSGTDEFMRLAQTAEKLGMSARCHLKIDTGMGRLGLWHEDTSQWQAAIRMGKNIQVEGVYTHFSSADSSLEFTETQRARFISALNTLDLPAPRRGQPLWIHADNSAGFFSFAKDSRFNAIRVGLLQFGYSPMADSAADTWKVQPVLSLHARVGAVKRLPAGATVSYARSHCLQRDSRLAILTAGYGDGIPVSCSNRGQVLIQGQRHPIIGRVTMDQIVVNITGSDTIQPGDPVVFIGRQGQASISIREYSEWAQSIPYECLCRISRRVPRIYHPAKT